MQNCHIIAEHITSALLDLSEKAVEIYTTVPKCGSQHWGVPVWIKRTPTRKVQGKAQTEGLSLPDFRNALKRLFWRQQVEPA